MKEPIFTGSAVAIVTPFTETGVDFDKLEELISIQVEAIKNIKIDKITVWDTGAGADGKGSTANFLSGLMQSVLSLIHI